MKPLPTDLQILDAIYERYYNEFAYQAASRKHKALLPIDVDALAVTLGVDVDIVFGRLHYHLEPKYRQVQENGDLVTLFLSKKDFGFQGVHFPYLSSVLAGVRCRGRRISPCGGNNILD